MKKRGGAFFAAGLTAALGIFSAVGEITPKEILERLDAAKLDPSAAIKVTGKTLDLGTVKILIEEGVLVPAEAIDGRRLEIAFVGKGKVQYAPPDPVEIGQLDLFTGNKSLDEGFGAAVFSGLPADSGILTGEPAGEPSLWPRDKAEELFKAWLTSPDRQVVGVRDSLLRLAAGDPAMQDYRAVWVRGDKLKDFLLRIDPQAFEQVLLGQFKRMELSELERWKLNRDLRFDMRAGRWAALDFEMLGGFDIWSAQPLTNPAGKGFFGDYPFLAKRYQIELTIDKDEEHISAKARIDLEATAGPAKSLQFGLFPDLKVSSVRDAVGKDLFFWQKQSVVTVVLPGPTSSAALELEYSGPLFKEVAPAVFENASTMFWYPRTESRGSVAFDVTFRYPTTIGLVASGIRTAGGVEGKTRWENRAFEGITAGFGFQVGDYEFTETKVGNVNLTLALNKRAQEWFVKTGRTKMLELLQEILQFYEKLYGPYPLDHLTVATTFSETGQGMAGFITLPDFVFRLRYTDYRIFTAHEMAHQWWGNLVTPAGPGDEWLSEGVSEFSSMLFGRRWIRKEKKLQFISPFSDWNDRLLNTYVKRRPVEWLGPVSLGYRLNSSLCGDCFEDIVYLKGGMVLDSLASYIGEDGLLKFLGRLVEERRGKSLSTDYFFEAFKRLSKLDMDWFRRRFIDDVGLPVVYFDYSVEENGSKGWVVKLHTEQEPDYGQAFSFVKLPPGTLDVSSRRVDICDLKESTLGIRWQSKSFREKFDPSAFKGADKYVPTDRDRREGNWSVTGRATLTGLVSDLTIEVSEKPLRFFLDPDDTIPAQFVCRSCNPMNVLRQQGSRRLDAGDFDGAESLLKKALDSPYNPIDPPGNVAEKMVHERGTRDTKAAIYYHLAELEIERGRDEQAWAFLKQGRTTIASDAADWVIHFGNNLEARLSLRKGDAKRAYQILWADMAPDKNNTTKGWMLMAIASKQLGEKKAFEKALGAIKKRPVDVTLLE